MRPGLGNDKVRGGCPGLGKSFKLISRTVLKYSTPHEYSSDQGSKEGFYPADLVRHAGAKRRSIILGGLGGEAPQKKMAMSSFDDVESRTFQKKLLWLNGRF